MSALTGPQLRLLLKPVNPQRVGKVRGMSHMEAWDIRRQLIRTFGFGGYDLETLALDLIAETNEGKRWTVLYRAQVRLTVKDAEGRVIARWEDGAAGDSVNQPSRGDAHDMAMKTALSQALKRCATNLGDQFGLSLYNDGSTQAVVSWSAAHPPEANGAPEPARPEDPPVRPEPAPQVPEAVPESEQPQPDTELQEAYAEMLSAAQRIGFEDQLPGQFLKSFGHPVADGTVAEYRQARDLLLGSEAA